jgi:hypothetical protein
MKAGSPAKWLTSHQPSKAAARDVKAVQRKERCDLRELLRRSFQSME